LEDANRLALIIVCMSQNKYILNRILNFFELGGPTSKNRNLFLM